MSTRSNIGVKNGNKVDYIYCHYDGYLEEPGVGYNLFKNFNTMEKAQELVGLGDLSSIQEYETDEERDKIIEDSLDPDKLVDICSCMVSTGRGPSTIRHATVDDFVDYVSLKKDPWIEYWYVFDDDDNRWKVAFKGNGFVFGPIQQKMTVNPMIESRSPRGRMLNEGITRDSVLTPEETKQAQKAFDGYVDQILQAARDGLPGKDWVIHSGTLGNPFSRSIWAVKNYDDENRSWDDFVNLFQVSLYEDYEGGRHLFEKGYFRLVNYLEDPEEDGGYIATVSDDKIWFSDLFEDRGREPGLFASASEFDRVEHIVKLRLKNR